jgi:hypothetical protein
MMATFQFPARRLIIAGGFAVAVAAAPAIAVFAEPTPAPAPLACPGGEEADIYTGNCVPHVVPNAGTPFSTTPQNPDVPTIGGIPCIGHNAARCIGLAQVQPPTPQVPQSTVGSSPTVTGHIGP